MNTGQLGLVFPMPYYRIDDRGFKQGDIIRAGRWGEIVRHTGEAHPQFEREKIYEDIRVAEFPDKPSRWTSSFAFRYWNDADEFHEWRWNNGSKQHMYLVEPVDPKAVVHTGFMYCMPPKDDAPIAEIARSYWRADTEAFGVNFVQTSPVEIVVPCDLIVKLLLTEQN